jgi:hypothetical protein
MSTDQKRRRLRFGLRSLLVFTTIAAVGSWAYWDGWSMWQWRRERLEFAQQVKSLKAEGDFQATRLLAEKDLHRLGPTGTLRIAGDRYAGFIQYDWPNASYIVYCDVQRQQHFLGPKRAMTVVGVEVFRLAPPPPHDLPRTSRGRNALRTTAALRQVHPHDLRIDDRPYFLDFLQMISGNRRDNLGFEYALIHSDPPPR